MTNEISQSEPNQHELSTIHIATTANEKLIAAFLSTTNANEISGTLQPMIDAYLVNSDASRTDLANSVNLVFKLQQLFFNLQQNL